MAGRVTGVLNALGYTAFPREHKKQILSLDREFHEMELEITRLNSEMQKLEAQVNPKQREIERLQEIIEADSAEKERAKKIASQKHAATPELKEDEVEVLRFLVFVRLRYDGAGVETAAIAKTLKTNEIRAKVLLRGLQERGFIWHDSRIVDGGWRLNTAGEEYVVNHDIV